MGTKVILETLCGCRKSLNVDKIYNHIHIRIGPPPTMPLAESPVPITGFYWIRSFRLTWHENFPYFYKEINE